MRRAVALALVLLIASFSSVAANPGDEDAYAELVNQDLCEYFPQTDKYLCFGFKSYWHEFGGLEIFGYPISNEMVVDGLTVQYFERARFEWHPGAWPERHDVLQGLLGNEVTADMRDHAAFAPVGSAKDGCIYYAVTGHNVCDQFAERWEMSGGLAIFGYPISEAFDDDGMLVQYFERARFEYQPGAWPERHDVLLGLLGTEVYAPDEEPEPEPVPEVQVLATDLAQPRGLLVTEDGIYVAEAGAGGDGPCAMLASGAEACIGLSGAISLVDGDGVTRVVEGLPSLIEETGEAIGVHDMVVDGDNIYAVTGLGANPAVRDEYGDGGELLASLIQIDSEGEVTVIADLGEFEAAENPDGAEDEEGAPAPDTNPYGLAMDGDDFIVVDAGGNSLLRVSMDGEIEVIAIFPARMVEAPPFIPADEVPMHAVPTRVAVGSDGNYYVSQLTGFPFPVGGANIYQVTPDGDVDVFAEGFTNAGDLAFDSEGRLLVLEIVAGGLLNVDQEAIGEGDVSSVASRIVRVEADGSQTEFNVPGVLFATGLAIGESDELYVSNMSVLPSAELIRIDLEPAAEGQSFSASLSGAEEVPPVGTAATGSATFAVSADGTSVDFELSVGNLDDVMMAHIHLAPAGENGSVVVWLYPDSPPAEHIPGTTTGVLATGTFTADDLAGPLEGENLSALIDAMNAGDAYVNVHTELYPAGEIRGQISAEHMH